MNVKNNIKKVFAVAVGTALVGATLLGAMAYDLSDYPAPFVLDGMAQGAIVVGANAATADVLGAIDIAASLQTEAVTATPIAGGTEVVVTGGEDYALDLNTNNANKTYDDSDLEGFLDSSADLDSTDYDFHEEVFLLEDGIRVATSIDSSYAEDDDYASDAWLELDDDSVIYRIVFDDTVTLTDFNPDEMDIKFAGQAITIQDVTDTSITVESATEVYMEVADEIEVDGHAVTLKNVGESAVLVQVDGQILSIGDGDTEEFDQADDFSVEVKNLFYIQGAPDNSATLKLGNSISETYDDGDALEIFDGEDDSDEATWTWNVVTSGGELEEIQAVLNINHRRNNNDNDPEKRAALMLGDEFMLPNNYGSISFSGWDDNSMGQYDTLEMEFDVTDLDSTPDVEVLEFTSSKDDAFVMDDGADASVVYLDDGNFWYKDDTDEIDSGAATMVLKLDDDEIDIVYDDALDQLNVSFPNGDELVLDVGDSMDAFGTEGDAEATDFNYADTGINTEHITGTNDEEVKTSYGVYWEDVESQLDGDELLLNIPHDGQTAKLIIKSKTSVVSAGGEGGMSYAVNPIEVGLGILDTDAPALGGDTPMIIVGGPNANTLAAEFLGNPTPEEVAATFTQGKALIKYDDAKKAMLVAGYEALETQGAAYVVADYKDYTFSGLELEVVVTDLQNIDVTVVS